MRSRKYYYEREAIVVALTPRRFPTRIHAHAATKLPRERARTVKCRAMYVFVNDSGNTACAMRGTMRRNWS